MFMLLFKKFLCVNEQKTDLLIKILQFVNRFSQLVVVTVSFSKIPKFY